MGMRYVYSSGGRGKELLLSPGGSWLAKPAERLEVVSASHEMEKKNLELQAFDLGTECLGLKVMKWSK